MMKAVLDRLELADERLDTMLALKDAVGDLPPIYQRQIRLEFYQEYNDAEIADKESITRAAVRKRRQRALEKLRNSLSQDGWTSLV